MRRQTKTMEGKMSNIEIVEHREFKKQWLKTPLEIKKKYKVFILLLLELGTISRLYEYPGYRLESLSGEMDGFKSIRLNNQWRVIFKASKARTIEIVTIRRITAHDYRKK